MAESDSATDVAYYIQILYISTATWQLLEKWGIENLFKAESHRYCDTFTSMVSFLLFVSLAQLKFPMTVRAANTIPVRQGISTAYFGGFSNLTVARLGKLRNYLKETSQ